MRAQIVVAGLGLATVQCTLLTGWDGFSSATAQEEDAGVVDSGDAPDVHVNTLAAVDAGPDVDAAIQRFTLFEDSSSVNNPNTTDPGAIAGLEVGVRWTSDIPASVIGVRFYKGVQNTGIHFGSLWTSTGTNLAIAAFTDETASGWQTVLFPAPIPIEAGQLYVASYFGTSGFYGYDPNFFENGWTRGPLHASSSVYVYNATSAFPTIEAAAKPNYGVDVIVVPR